MGNADTVQGSAWRRVRASVLRQARYDSAPCAICGKPIDYDLSGRIPSAPSVDHIIPRSQGGSLLDPDNCRPVHLGCNSERGATQRRRPSVQETLAALRSMGTAPPSREW